MSRTDMLPDTGTGTDMDKKPYRAVVVATMVDSGVVFAKRSDSVVETDHIIFDSISNEMSNTFDDKGYARMTNYRDEFDEWVTRVEFFNEEGKFIMTIDYKVCFDD